MAAPAATTGLLDRALRLDDYELLICFSLFILVILCTRVIRVVKADARYHGTDPDSWSDHAISVGS